jgi:hypothetical protein
MHAGLNTEAMNWDRPCPRHDRNFLPFVLRRVGVVPGWEHDACPLAAGRRTGSGFVPIERLRS